MSPIRIQHFSDLLCVWAYVSQARIDELRATFGEQIDVDGRYVSVFGNTHAKLKKNWGERGGNQAYGAHVREIVARFGHVEVHPEVWCRDIPHSSLPAHLLLCAIRCLETAGVVSAGSSSDVAWRLRLAFFRDLADISNGAVLRRVADEAGLSIAAIESVYDSGEAHAALAADFDLVREHDVRASPTMIFNEGRQRLTGNVGYRIIEANVRELLDGPTGQHSWC